MPMTSCAQIHKMTRVYYDKKYCDKRHIETKDIFIVVRQYSEWKLSAFKESSHSQIKSLFHQLHSKNSFI